MSINTDYRLFGGITSLTLIIATTAESIGLQGVKSLGLYFFGKADSLNGLHLSLLGRGTYEGTGQSNRFKEGRHPGVARAPLQGIYMDLTHAEIRLYGIPKAVRGATRPR